MICSTESPGEAVIKSAVIKSATLQSIQGQVPAGALVPPAGPRWPAWA